MRLKLVILAAAVALAGALPGAQYAATAPAAPTGITGVALGGSVQLAWSPVAGASGYTVYRGATPTTVTTALTAVGGVAGTTFTDTTAANGTTYYYVVRSVSAAVESANSLVVRAKPVPRGCSTGNPVVLENCYPGDSPWNVRNTATVAAGGIEGYATAQSINKGDSLPIKVNTGAGSTFDIEIYRSGYYGGAGARLFSLIKGVPGVTQPACAADATTGLLDCANWSVSATITTTSSWPSGVYLLRLVRQDTGADNQILFVVRDDSSSSDLLYGTAMSTFEAYNNYGGKSLYTFNSSGNTTVSGTTRAVKVSFDRPFEQPRSGLRDWYTRTEFASVYWLEQEGYDISYVSNTDLETNSALMQNHKAYISPAHDEYIAGGMRSALQNARDAGVNLFFTGSNEVYWKIRFENSPTTGASMRTEVCYKTVESGGPDPSGISTSTWRDPNGPNQPENALTGEMYVGDNDTTYFPLVVSATQGGDRIYRYTGLDTQTPGTSTAIGKNLVGWEWDARVANGFEPAGVKTLASSPVTGNLIQNYGHNQIAGSTSVSMVKYVAPSGALVVTTGTNHWNRGLALNADAVGEPDTRIQQVTTNILEDMGAAPQTPPSSITLDTPPAGRPPAPAGLTASASGSDAVQLSWSAVTGADGYNVYRALVARDGGLPLGTLVSPQLVTGTTFSDVGLASSTSYYYVVTAVVAGAQSAASNEAQVVTNVSAGDPIRINAGGPSYTSSAGVTYRADSFFTGGTATSWSKTVNGTNDPGLYRDERWGQFSYSIPVTNGVYDVRFHFAELFYSAPCAGKRVFGMDILDTPTSPDLANIDICAAVGPLAAYDRTVSRVTVSDGSLDIKSVYGSADDPEVTAIEVIPDEISPTVTQTSPLAGSKDIPVSDPVSASFSEAMDSTTLTTSTFTLTAPGGVSVPASVSYDSSTATATLTPSAALAFGTTYTATLAATVKASDGTPLTSPVSWSFTTHQPHAPGVTSTFPAGAATGVSPSVSVQALFDRALDPSTVTSASFYLASTAGTRVSATVSYDGPTQTATLVPQQALATGTSYTATLTSQITASDGTALAGAVSWTFTTAATAPAPPTIASSVPADGTTGVTASTTVQATFSRDMYAPSITASSFTLSDPTGPVSASVVYDSTSRTATLTPASPLASATLYTAKLAASVTAADGTPFGSAATWSFTTSPAPTVTATSPTDGAAYVSRTGAITATFSRDMSSSTITSSSFTVSAGGAAAPATVSYDSTSRTATLTPSSALASGTTYTARLDTTVRASDGSALAQPYSWTFTTAACPCTIFPDILQPATSGASTQDGRTGTGPWSYELGTKFSVDESMQLTAFRFYKSPGETGTHVGKLWTTNGTLLAQQTFATETASGWQQQALSAPVTLQANSVYVVSFNANAYFVSTRSGLATQTISGPIRTVADGANGVYGASAGTFPTQSFSSTNYFADAYVVPAGDQAPPGVVSTSPLSAATGIATTTAVTATFSRSMDPTTLTASTFQLSSPSGSVAATVTYDDATTTARLAPSAALAASTTYTARLTTGVRARDGMPLAAPVQWTFTTGTPPPPQVVRTVPTSGATDATTNSTVSAVFSKAMNASTITSSTFTLASASGTAIAATVSYDSLSLAATLTPSAPLTAGATYTATLAATIAATDGGTLSTPYRWSFTVASGTLPPPTVMSTTPANGATSVPRSPTITATFSRSLDPTTVTTSTVTLTGSNGAAVTSSVSYNDATQTVTLTPASQLAGSTTYTATVTTGVKATDGTPLSAPATWSFTTAACPCSLFSLALAPATTSLSTVDGRKGTGPFTYEMGVKLTATQTMQLTAIRFYKDTKETGTHVGRVWTSTGVQLGSVAFATETASGWQEQALSSPLTLQAGSVYVISVNANAYFVMTKSGLATQVTSGPLQSVADGKNGVYGSSAGTFPTSSFSSSNYFVDIVASPAPSSPPAVTATSPTSNATGTNPTAPVTATFSRAMDVSSITGSTFTLTGPSGQVTATVSYDSTTTTAKLTAGAPLAFSTTYTARIDSSIRSSDGIALPAPVSWSFTTGSGTPPQVTKVVPASGATDVNAAVVLKADFSRPLNPATVTKSTFTLTGPSGAIVGAVSYDTTAQEASLTPSAALAPGSYTATLAASIATTDGATLGTPYTWSFTVPTTPMPLSITSANPPAGATGVARDTTVIATFNRDVTASSVNTSSFTLTGPSGAVSASVSYDATSKTATLTPAAQLDASATYTAQLSSSIHADDGTALTSGSWTFTTGQCPCSVLSASTTPATTGNPVQDGRTGTGPFSYELGMKFTVDSPVQLSAIRFFKDAKETGTHVGTLWTASGTKLASVTFTGESASGWQQQALSSPVQLQPGTVYVVSYNVNAYFDVTAGGLATSQGLGPVHSVADGANGVYGAAAGVFPTQTYNSSNYFVDIVAR